jgi:hypothetical protein
MGMDGGFRYCPECGAEYRAGFTRCHDCQVELVDEPPELTAADVTELDEGGPLVEVFAASHIEADIVRAALEDNGIQAVIAKGGTAAYPLTVGEMGEGRVLVPEQDGQAALEIIGTLEPEEEDDFEEAYEPGIFAARTSKEWTWWVALGLAVAMILFLVIEIRY